MITKSKVTISRPVVQGESQHQAVVKSGLRKKSLAGIYSADFAESRPGSAAERELMPYLENGMGRNPYTG
jgi:hypothetical protein